MTVSPGGAAGLDGVQRCSAWSGEHGDEAHCPAASRVGTVELASPALSDPLIGDRLPGEERPSERLRLFVVAPGPGVVVKFVGALHVDPVYGSVSRRRSRTFPRSRFRRLSLSFDGGPGACSHRRCACGPATAVGKFVPYGGGAPVESRASVAIARHGSPATQCPGVAAIRAAADHAQLPDRGSVAPTALSVSVLRRDGEQVPAAVHADAAGRGSAPPWAALQACPDADVGGGGVPGRQPDRRGACARPGRAPIR